MKKSLRDKIRKDTLLLDGAFGTYIQLLGLKDEDYKDKPGCAEYLNLTRPDLIEKLHSDYLEAGSDAVETNTFGGNSLKLGEYGLSKKVYDINLEAGRIARKAADAFSTSSFPRFVIGTMGPTGKLPSSTDPELGAVTYADLKKIFCEQALGIIDSGADALLVETGQDLLEMKAAVVGATEAIKERRKDLVLMAQCTLANNGRMLLGTDISAVVATLSYLGVDVIGLNCSTGPVEMEPALRYLSKKCPVHISCVPNAGLPIESGGKTIYPLGASDMAEILSRYASEYGLDVIGGCCGTDPVYIKKIRKMMKPYAKRQFPRVKPYASFYKGYDIGEAPGLLKVGERINTQGSRKMKELLIKEDFDSIVELAKVQEDNGADLIDVCAVLSERQTEKRDALVMTKRLAESVEIPLMIDSTDAEVISAALENYPGTAFINSVNLEDDGERAGKVFELAKEHGSFVVCLTIDEKGMAKTRAHKLRIAKKLYKIATQKYGLEGHRLIFDLLTFTLGTGGEEYASSAVETIEAIRQLKKELPDVLTSLGVSNVSFGLQKASRRVLNAAFLYHSVEAGLDMAIVNPADDLEYGSLSGEDRRLADDVVFNSSPDALTLFVGRFAEAEEKKEEKTEEETLDISGRIKKCIFDRNKTGIIPLLDEALKEYQPEDIINNILMDSMREVGDKLESGDMVLPYVLQSAEVMRKGLQYLEDMLPHDVSRKKGKVLLATVFGDVHDIGKNLVRMILSNNGFDVIDLGKQVPVERIIEEAKKQKVDAVGLSALLVSTARHMKTCVQAMHDAGLEYPLIIGGAPVNEDFAKDISALEDASVYKGGVFYAKDAFTGLKIMQTLSNSSDRKKAMEEYMAKSRPGVKEKKEEHKTKKEVSPAPKTPKKHKVPTPPFYGKRSFTGIPVDDVFAHLNEELLFERGWKAKPRNEEEKTRMIEKEFRPMLKKLKEECLRKRWLDLKAVYGYFRCRVNKDIMEVLSESGEVLETFKFERVGTSHGGALTDYFRNKKEGEDVVAFQAVTVGSPINLAIERLYIEEKDAKAFLLHGLGIYLAEALAEYIHGRIRKELKLKKSEGKRYSPGYPLWKDLGDQKKIFRLLDIEERLDVKLSPANQMIPEQSTTAMIVYDPSAEY